MNIYKISQNYVRGYDTYDSAVVAARTEDEAKNIHPNGYKSHWCSDSWCRPEQVKVEFLAKFPKNSEYGEGCVICSSFNAG